MRLVSRTGAALGLALASLLALGCANASFEAKDYSASAKGYGGDVTVTLSVAGDKIVGVAVSGAAETPAIGGAAVEQYGPRLAAALEGKKLAAADLAAVEAVSGASFTSKAVLAAASRALASAKGLAPAAARKPVSDSVAVYPAIGHSLVKKLSVEVALKDGAIASIAVADHGETPAILKTVVDLLIPRIIAAQSLAVDSITGATVSSAAVKGAVAAAIDASGGDSSEWYSPVAKKGGLVKLEGYDVVVVGLGGSGMAAYASAAGAGAKVFGLDSAGKVGGTSTNVSGPMAINPALKMQAENGGKKWLEEEDLIQDWLAYTRGDAKEALVRKFVNESGETMDWLVAEQGFSFDKMRSFFHPKGWVVWATYKGDKDAMYVKAIEAAKARDPKNDYKLELTATGLIAEGGKILGVKARYHDGTTYEIYGDSVILATGGFIGNAEMKKQYLGGDYRVEGMMQDDGAGIRMAQAVGAATYNIRMPPMVHVAKTKDLVLDDELDPQGKAYLTALVLKSDALIVNASGERYMNEGGNIAFDNWKGGPLYYSVYSQAQMDQYRTKGMAIVANPMRGQGGKAVPNVPVADLDAILAVGEKRGIVVKAATMAELAAKLGAPGLPAAAAKYTAIAKGGPDPLGKKAELFSPLDQGPFYAVKGAGYPYGTCGGLDIDENLNVLKTDGSPIPNLYAVGQDSMGVLFSEKGGFQVNQR